MHPLLSPDPDLWDVELGDALAEPEMWMDGLAVDRDGETGCSDSTIHAALLDRLRFGWSRVWMVG